MVERGHGLEPSAEEHALGKVVSKAFHCEMRGAVEQARKLGIK
jgi:hypothetical protein